MNTKRLSGIFPGLLLIFTILANLNTNGQSIENQNFIISFNKNEGTLSAQLPDGKFIFTGCVNAINYEGITYLADNQNYTFRVEKVITTDNQELIISGKDKNKKIDFEKRIILPAQNKSIQIEVTYKNISKKHIRVGSIEPIRLTNRNNGSLYFENAQKCLTNGAMYYDAGMIQSFDKPYTKPEPYGETKGGVLLDLELNNNKQTVQSWWNIALFNGYKRESMSVGYISNKNSMGRIQVLKNNEKQLSLIAESVFNPGFILKKLSNISSDKCAIVLGPNPYSVLEEYANLMAAEIIKPSPEIVNGWCNWFYTLDKFDEAEILRNARFASTHLKPYGFEYIQIDEGFQKHHGEWEANNNFPHGLKGLCDSIKSFGLKPGIWIAPFVISENTAIFKQHPEWLVKDTSGKPVRIGPWPNENTDWYKTETPKRYCLDITQQGAEIWFTNLIDTIVNYWGFEMIKVDFVAWTVFSANSFFDPGTTPAQVYRQAMKIMKGIAKEKCHILDCGPGNITAGYINSMRVEYDQNYGQAADAWKQYFLGSSSSAGAAGKRYFYHNKVWTNDIDHVCIDILSMQNAEAISTLIGLSGGNVMSGDRLLNLSQAKTEILKKILPSTIEQVKPVDLYDSDPQTVFACKIKRKFAEWDLVAFFNPDLLKSVNKKYSFDRFWLDSDKTYLCFDFWNEKFIGEISKNIDVTINPGSVVLYSLHEKGLFPKIISTNRHIKQGAVEIEDTYFDSEKNILHCTSVSPAGSSHSVYVYMPEPYGWIPENGKIYQYNKDFTIRSVDKNMLRIDITFTGSDKKEWSIEFRKY